MSSKIFARRKNYGWKFRIKTKIEILDIATEGLKKRGHGEEQLLQPLYRRAEAMTNPAKEMVKGLEQGKTMKDFILQYAKVS